MKVVTGQLFVLMLPCAYVTLYVLGVKLRCYQYPEISLFIWKKFKMIQ